MTKSVSVTLFYSKKQGKKWGINPHKWLDDRALT